ncbi:hypothetical protein IKD57_04150 [Candidatus Saccharibacteria bacterium]|nr:hypothetical protein [Candidatus Saccharibacteria bacterium]
MPKTSKIATPWVDHIITEIQAASVGIGPRSIRPVHTRQAGSPQYSCGSYTLSINMSSTHKEYGPSSKTLISGGRIEGYAAERKSEVPVVVILRIGTTAIEIQATGVGTGLHGARPIGATVTCVVQSGTVDVASADEE